MGAENYHFVNVRSSLDRVLATHFDWLEVSLSWNFIEYVSVDQLSPNIRMFIVNQRRLYKSFTLHNVQSFFLCFFFRRVFNLNEHMQSLKFPVEVTLSDV